MTEQEKAAIKQSMSDGYFYAEFAESKMEVVKWQKIIRLRIDSLS